ncbi:MAG: succinate dehydrogenase, hydrophobic membrane anchor protein [Gammaproteobacteria bacterium]|nr:succinate dehydrogenase, hydrophobic membrane anchor protein [Gammaproteobacteria bacterium]
MTEQVASGLRAWTMQRLSALYILVFTVYAGFCFATRGATGFDQWVSWLRDPFNNITVGLFILALLFHAWVGSRDIILDYVKAPGLRLVMLAVLAFLLIAMGLWEFKVLLTIVVR